MPPVPPNELTIVTAQKQRDEAIIHGTLVFFGIAAGAGILSPVVPNFMTKIAGGVTGFHIDPTKVRPIASPGKFLALYILPAPAGVVPPELYGLPPDYVKDFAPGLPQTTLLANVSTKERTALFDAEQEVDRIIARASGPKGQRSQASTQTLLSDLAFLHALGAPVGEQFLAPPRSETAFRTVERELVERGVVVPLRVVTQTQQTDFTNLRRVVSIAGVAGTIEAVQLPRPAIAIPNPVMAASGGFNPHAIKPNTTLARASAEKADFTRKDHVTERADP